MVSNPRGTWRAAPITAAVAARMRQAGTDPDKQNGPSQIVGTLQAEWGERPTVRFTGPWGPRGQSVQVETRVSHWATQCRGKGNQKHGTRVQCTIEIPSVTPQQRNAGQCRGMVSHRTLPVRCGHRSGWPRSTRWRYWKVVRRFTAWPDHYLTRM